MLQIRIGEDGKFYAEDGDFSKEVGLIANHDGTVMWDFIRTVEEPDA